MVKNRRLSFSPDKSCGPEGLLIQWRIEIIVVERIADGHDAYTFQ